ncbi:MAG: hypothetical protein EZS28_018963, partial [Streblomastix strix]
MSLKGTKDINQVIYNFAVYLLQHGYVASAHFCLILIHQPMLSVTNDKILMGLVTGNHFIQPMTFGTDPKAIILSEIYESLIFSKTRAILMIEQGYWIGASRLIDDIKIIQLNVIDSRVNYLIKFGKKDKEEGIISNIFNKLNKHSQSPRDSPSPSIQSTKLPPKTEEYYDEQLHTWVFPDNDPEIEGQELIKGVDKKNVAPPPPVR